MVAEAKSVESPFSKVSAYLIERNYQEIGCDSWNRQKFFRLCGKLQRTEIEMAALLRITPAGLAERLKMGFSKQDGMLLTMFEREIDTINSGAPPTRGMFLMAVLPQTSPP